MYISGKQMGLMAKIMQALAESHDEQEIRKIVGDLVMQLLQAQFYASFVWQPENESLGSRFRSIWTRTISANTSAIFNTTTRSHP